MYTKEINTNKVNKCLFLIRTARFEQTWTTKLFPFSPPPFWICNPFI